jgi:hypothetical protein
MAKKRTRRNKPVTLDAAQHEPQRLRFSAAIPGGGEAGPLWKIAVEALTEPAVGGGERTRLRAHIQTNLASVLKPALAQLARGAETRAQQALGHLPEGAVQLGRQALAPVGQQARQWLARGVQASAPLLARLSKPFTGHDLNTWLEIDFSTAPLVAGAQALLPQASKLGSLGITPQTGPNAPPVQAWQGQIGNEVAQVSLLRMDDRQLPEALRSQLKGQPFQLAAALVNVATRKA